MNDLQKLIVAQSTIIGEAIGILTGLSFCDDIPIDTQAKMQQLAEELREDHEEAKKIIPELANH
jgi:hypothetical protein